MEHKKPTWSVSKITYEDALYFLGGILFFGLVIVIIDCALEYFITIITNP